MYENSLLALTMIAVILASITTSDTILKNRVAISRLLYRNRFVILGVACMITYAAIGYLSIEPAQKAINQERVIALVPLCAGLLSIVIVVKVLSLMKGIFAERESLPPVGSD